MKIHHCRVPVLAVAAMLTVLGAGHVAAQSQRTIHVAIPDAFPEIDARAIVVREPGRDIVVMRADEATPETLAMSLFVLRKARERAPNPSSGEMIPITGFVLTADLDGQRRARLERVLERLSRRPVRNVGSFGPGRWIQYAPR